MNPIQKARKKSGYTQEALARKCNITLRNYQNIEHYIVIPNVITALKISTLLKCDPYVLWKEKLLNPKKEKTA